MLVKNDTINLKNEAAERLIEELHLGQAPKKNVHLFNSGNEKFLNDIENRYLKGRGSSAGKIRFVNGGWGTGKTHFLRMLAKKGFDNNFLVSTTILDNSETPFNKFEEVYKSIVQNITSKNMFDDDTDGQPNLWLARIIGDYLGASDEDEQISKKVVEEKKLQILKDVTIDSDFRKVIIGYMETFCDEENKRWDNRLVLQNWLSGEGRLSDLRKELKSIDINVNKMPDKSNAKTMLGSLAKFVRLIGYPGIMILIDEAARWYSSIRQSEMKLAQNNLLHIINTIDEMDGALFVYATTRDFFDDPNYGIIHYGALSGRIGLPQDRPPYVLDRIWNIDSIKVSEEDYKKAALKLREIYSKCSPENLMPEDELTDKISEAVEDLMRSRRSPWRILTKTTLSILDEFSMGNEDRSGHAHFQSVIGVDDQGYPDE